MCIYIYIHIYKYIHMYIYIYIYIGTRCAEQGGSWSTPSPPIKSLDFRGFDSSRLLILRGGNSHVR